MNQKEYFELVKADEKYDRKIRKALNFLFNETIRWAGNKIGKEIKEHEKKCKDAKKLILERIDS